MEAAWGRHWVGVRVRPCLGFTNGTNGVGLVEVRQIVTYSSYPSFRTARNYPTLVITVLNQVLFAI